VPAFQFQNVILHQLPDGQGWEIIGVRHNPKTQEIIATVAPIAGQDQAEKLANQLAKNLAGKTYADLD
jgi:hypothetical protein